MLTGRYPSAGVDNASSGSVFFNMRPIDRRHSLPALLQRHGYRAAFFGKYHAHRIRAATYTALQAEIREIGFDVAEAVYPGNLNEWPPPTPSGRPLEHLPEWVVAKCVEFIDQHFRGAPQPVFVSFNPTLEHAPFAPSLCTQSWYTPQGEWRPDTARADAITRRRGQLMAHVGMRCERGVAKAIAPRDSGLHRAHGGLHRVALSVWLQDGLATLLDAFARAGALKDTLVVHVGDHGTRLKGTVHGAARVPLWIRWGSRLPMEGPSTLVRHPVSTVDLAPTLLDAAGAQPPRSVFDGHSLLPLLPLLPLRQAAVVTTTPPPLPARLKPSLDASLDALLGASLGASLDGPLAGPAEDVSSVERSVGDRDGVLIEMCQQRAVQHTNGWKLVTTRLTYPTARKYECRHERLSLPFRADEAHVEGAHGGRESLWRPSWVFSRKCAVPAYVSAHTLEADAGLRASLGPWLQLMTECDEASPGVLRPFPPILRWAKWWLPGLPTMDAFSNVTSLEPEQLYDTALDPLEHSNRRRACPRELFCMQALLRREVVRAAKHGGAVAHGGAGALRASTRRAEVALSLLLGRSAEGVGAMNTTRLAAAEVALGCHTAHWHGRGWCRPTPSPPSR